MILPSLPGPETTECVCEPRQVCTWPTCTGRVRSLMSKMRRPRKRSALTSSLTPSSPQSTRPRVSCDRHDQQVANDGYVTLPTRADHRADEIRYAIRLQPVDIEAVVTARHQHVAGKGHIGIGETH